MSAPAAQSRRPTFRGSTRGRYVEHVMGFPVSLDVPAGGRATTTAFESMFAMLRAVDRRFSTYRADSEISRLRRGELPLSGCHPTVHEVLDWCRVFEERSFGAFRARRPGAGLDPTGVVKGWAMQRAADQLRAAGLRDFCLNAGGDVIVDGEPAPGRSWRVGIRHPDRSDAVCAVLGLRDAAVATSGAYERGPHIVDGATGLPPTGLRSVTIVADSLLVADATATAAFAMGERGPAWAALQPGCLLYAVTEDGRVLRSAGLDSALADDPGLTGESEPSGDDTRNR